jgi:predicted ATPase
VNLDRFPSADVNAAPDLTPAEDRAAAAEQFDWNSRVDASEGALTQALATIDVQCKRHPEFTRAMQDVRYYLQAASDSMPEWK